MSDAERWLEEHIAGAPDHLRTAMLHALRETSAMNVAEHLAEAGLMCLRTALRDPAKRPSALDLLAADALFTHACEAAAADNVAAVARFADKWNALRFEELLIAALVFSCSQALMFSVL